MKFYVWIFGILFFLPTCTSEEQTVESVLKSRSREIEIENAVFDLTIKCETANKGREIIIHLFPGYEQLHGTIVEKMENGNIKTRTFEKPLECARGFRTLFQDEKEYWNLPSNDPFWYRFNSKVWSISLREKDKKLEAIRYGLFDSKKFGGVTADEIINGDGFESPPGKEVVIPASEQALKRVVLACVSLAGRLDILLW